MEEAREAAARAVEVDPASADAWVNLGLIALAGGQPAQARVHAERVLAADARHPGALALGARAHQGEGNLPAAAARWRTLAALRPEDPAVLTGLATVLAQSGSPEESLALFERAAALAPDHPGVVLEQAAVLERLGRADAALAALRGARARASNPGIGVHCARLLVRLGRRTEALAELDAVLAMAPDDAAVWIERALLMQDLDRGEGALASCDRALALQPTNAAVWSARGVILGMQDRHEDALACHGEAVALAPAAPEAWSNRGGALNALNRYEEALADFDEAIRLDPRFAQAWTNRGVVQLALGFPDRALADHDAAIAVEPGHAKAWLNRSIALDRLGRADDAMASVTHAIELAPGDHAARVARAAMLCAADRAGDAALELEESMRRVPADPERRMDLSQLRLQCMDFARGWSDYEARFRTKAYGSAPLATSLPRWDGHRSASRLLIWGEQGLGDQILHGSMLQDAASLPQPVSVALDPRLAGLFQRSFPGLRVISGLEGLSESGYDEQVPIGSLGQTFRRSVEDFARSRTGWLRADPDRVAEVRAGAGLPAGRRVGISWRSLNARIGTDKSIALEALATALAGIGVSLVDLQYGSTPEELERCRESTGVPIHRVPGVDLREDLEGVAAIISACDAVVTISNTVAHLAGALGRPTLLLLPRVAGRIWYWTEVDGRSLWYRSVRILRQDVQGDWSTPLARSRSLLKDGDL
jgi:tetratricopeptide (TPR) repeat protein